MTIKIGEIIKKLRTANHITQDALASAVGVTPQAVSRWELEGGYPDIELLPTLADFFSVSTDELLGYKLSEREERLGEIKKELERLDEIGTVEEQISFARIALSKYPSDCEIKGKLALYNYFLWEETEEESLLLEAENLALSVLDECKDPAVCHDAITTLMTIYADSGRSEKAMEMTERLAPLKYCREFAKSCGIGDGNTEQYIQDQISKLVGALDMSLGHLAIHPDLPDDPSTWDRKIEIMNTSNRILHMIFGDNLMYNHSRLAFNYWIISTYEIAGGKREEALLSLEQMCRHAVAYDSSYQSDHGKHFTSIYTDKLIYPEPGKDFHEFKEHSNCYYMLDRLEHSRYDALRDHPRFTAVLDALQEYAR